MSDIGEISFLPPIMAALQKIAPDVGIDIVAVDVTKLAEWLSSGKIGAAPSNRGYVPTASVGEVIFTDHYVCVASSRHPRLTSELTMRQYLDERHVLVAPESGHSLVEERLQELGYTRRIALCVPAFQRAGGGYRDHRSLALGSLAYCPQVCRGARHPDFRSSLHSARTRNHAAVARAQRRYRCPTLALSNSARVHCRPVASLGFTIAPEIEEAEAVIALDVAELR